MSGVGFTIEPIEGKRAEHDGFQYGWRILKDGHRFLEMIAGGTGECWNIRDPYDDDVGAIPFHVCELDDFIAALTEFRDHEAHRANVRRWA